MAIYDQYVTGMFRRFGYFSTWLPNTKVTLGDVGFKRGKLFERRTSLHNLGISFSVRDSIELIDLSHSSSSGVSINLKAVGSDATGSLPVDKAGAIIQFGSEGAFVFQAANCRIYEIEDKIELGRQLIRAYQQNVWESEWVVVDTVVEAGEMTALISNTGNAKLELTAEKDLGVGNLALASMEAGLSVRSQTGDVTQIIAERRAFPLFKLSRVKHTLFQWLNGAEPAFEDVRRARPVEDELVDDELAGKALESVGLDDEVD
jgi:hypothetical protein